MASRTIDVISKLATGASALLLIGILCHIMLEIILRNIFHTSTFVLDEFVGYAVSGLAFLAMGETFRNGGLISVTLVEALVSRKVWAWSTVFANTLAVAVGLLLTFYIGRSALINFMRGTTSGSIADVPQFIPQAILCIGTAIFLLRALEATIISVKNATSGERS